MTICAKPGFFHRLIPSMVCLALLFSATALHALAPLAPEQKQSDQCIQIIRALERFHYLEKAVDNPLSQMLLDRYIKRLDPSKRLFTAPDIQGFSRYRFEMDDELKRGNLKPAFDIFNRYFERAVDRMDYILALIDHWETDLDFTLDETLVTENDLRKPCQNDLALAELWRQDLKNHIITMLLNDRAPADITRELKKIYENRRKRLLQTESADVFQIFMNAVTESFDPHTQFYPPRASEEFQIHMSNSLEGIGAVLQTEYDYTKVVRLIPKGPADKSKQLSPGDRIIGVGEGRSGEIKDTIGQRIDHVVKLIRGPKNTIVRLKIIPAEKASETKTIEILRDKVKLEDQLAKKERVEIDHQGRRLAIGIISVPAFYLDVTRDVQRLLTQLKKEGIDGLILDLRDNGGGSLPEARKMSGLFIKSGPVVQVRYKKQIRREYDEDPQIHYTGPLVVLINRMSASASEILAGAIKDYNRGLVVGTRSFGKGTVQYLQRLGDGQLKLTSAKFYRVSGESTQHRGVLPDIGYPQLYRVEDTGESSLETALPWDTVFKSFYHPYPSMALLQSRLRQAYLDRIKDDPAIQYLQQRIALAARISDQTQVSLNLQRRRALKQEYEQAELDIENQYRNKTGQKPLTELTREQAKINDTKQILMEQTHRVMADLISSARTLGLAWH